MYNLPQRILLSTRRANSIVINEDFTHRLWSVAWKLIDVFESSVDAVRSYGHGNGTWDTVRTTRVALVAASSNFEARESRRFSMSEVESVEWIDLMIDSFKVPTIDMPIRPSSVKPLGK